MATALVTEYKDLAEDSAGRVMQAGKEPAQTAQSVTYTTSTASSAFSGNTYLVRIIADADVHVSFGASPTATASSTRIPADTAEYFGVVPGQKVACYDGSS